MLRRVAFISLAWVLCSACSSDDEAGFGSGGGAGTAGTGASGGSGGVTGGAGGTSGTGASGGMGGATGGSGGVSGSGGATGGSGGVSGSGGATGGSGGVSGSGGATGGSGGVSGSGGATGGSGGVSGSGGATGGSGGVSGSGGATGGSGGATGGSGGATGGSGGATGGSGGTGGCDANGHVVINELVPNPPSSDSGHEWLELYNPTCAAVSIAGWVVEAGTSTFNPTFTLPSGASVPSLGYVVIGGAQVTFADFKKSTALNMGNASGSADAVRLVTATNVVVDTVVYGSPNSDGFVDDTGGVATSLAPTPTSSQALARSPNGTDTNACGADFVATFTSTPGASN